MRIVFVMSRLTHGGTERACLNTAIAYANAGMKVFLIVKEQGDAQKYTVPPNIEVICYGKTENGNQYPARRRIKRLRDVVTSINPKWVVSFNQRYIDLILSGLLIKYKSITSERFYPKKHYEGRPVDKLISLATYCLSTKVVFQTPENRDCYGKSIRRKSVVIPNAIAPNLPEYQWSKDKKLVVTACRLESQKNLPLLLNAFAIFYDTHREYRLRIYGDGSLKKSLLKQVEQLKLNQCVDILPFRSDVHIAILEAGMFVSSSDFEGIQNSLLEAMGMGIPCVATDCLGGGARLLIGDDERGLLVPMGESSGLAGAMCKIADDESLSKHYSCKGKALKKLYSVDAIAEEWIRLIQ